MAGIPPDMLAELRRHVEQMPLEQKMRLHQMHKQLEGLADRNASEVGEAQQKEFNGTLTLLDRYRSTTVTTGNNITCSRTTPSTNYTKEMFTHRDSFVAELHVSNFSDGPVHLGLLDRLAPAQPTDKRALGSSQVHDSFGLVVRPGSMELLHKDSVLCRDTWEGGCDSVVLRLEWHLGRLTLSVNGKTLDDRLVKRFGMLGDHRIGVSLTTAGQSAQLRVISYSLASSLVNKGPFFRFADKGLRQAKLHDDNRTVKIHGDGSQIIVTDALLEPGRPAFSVQLRVMSSERSPVWFGVVPARILDGDAAATNPWEREGAIMARVEKGKCAMTYSGSSIAKCEYDGNDPYGIRLIITDFTTVSFFVDNSRLAPNIALDAQLREPYRVVAVFTRAGQAADIGDEEDTTAQIETTTCRNDLFQGDFYFNSFCPAMMTSNNRHSLTYKGRGNGTNYSDEYFTSDDRFAVEMTPDDMCGGRLYLGFISTGAESKILNSLCGSGPLQPSAACVIEPRRVGVVFQAEWVTSEEFDASAQNDHVVRFEFDKGVVRFFVNGRALDCSKLDVFEGTFRLGVSVVKTGQRASIKTSPLSTEAEVESPAVPPKERALDFFELIPGVFEQSVPLSWGAATEADVSCVAVPTYSAADALILCGERRLPRATSTSPAGSPGDPLRIGSSQAQLHGAAVESSAAGAVLSHQLFALAECLGSVCQSCGLGSVEATVADTRSGALMNKCFDSSKWHCTKCDALLCDACFRRLLTGAATHEHGIEAFRWSAGGLYCRIDLVIEETQGQPIIVGLVPATTRPEDVAACKDGFLVCLDPTGTGKRPAVAPDETPLRAIPRAAGLSVTITAGSNGDVTLIANGVAVAFKSDVPVSRPHRIAVAFSAPHQTAWIKRMEKAPAHNSRRRIIPAVEAAALTIPMLSGNTANAPATSTLTTFFPHEGQIGVVIDVLNNGLCRMEMKSGVVLDAVPIVATVGTTEVVALSTEKISQREMAGDVSAGLSLSAHGVMEECRAARARVAAVLGRLRSHHKTCQQVIQEYDVQRNRFQTASFADSGDWRLHQDLRRAMTDAAGSVIDLPADAIPFDQALVDMVASELADLEAQEGRFVTALRRTSDTQEGEHSSVCEATSASAEASGEAEVLMDAFFAIVSRHRRHFLNTAERVVRVANEFDAVSWRRESEARRQRAGDLIRAHEPWHGDDGLQRAQTVLGTLHTHKDQYKRAKYAHEQAKGPAQEQTTAKALQGANSEFAETQRAADVVFDLFPGLERRMIERGNVTPKAFESLLAAASRGDTERVKEHIVNKNMLEWNDEQGRTVLHRAAAEGQQEVVNALLIAGAKTHQKDASGATALELAYRHGHGQVGRRIEMDMVSQLYKANALPRRRPANAQQRSSVAAELIGAVGKWQNGCSSSASNAPTVTSASASVSASGERLTRTQLIALERRVAAANRLADEAVVEQYEGTPSQVRRATIGEVGCQSYYTASSFE